MVRVHFGPPLQKKNLYGGLAQLGERLPCKQEVTGSIPVLSTTFKERLTETSKELDASLSLLKKRPRTKSKPSASGFDLERRNKAAVEF